MAFSLKKKKCEVVAGFKKIVLFHTKVDRIPRFFEVQTSALD